jgi:hypothetical protein
VATPELDRQRDRCKKRTGGKKSSVCPIVNRMSLLVQERVSRKFPTPAAIMSGPNRLAGRRDQASSPHSTYEMVIQLEREARTRGCSPNSSLTATLASAAASEKPAATQPDSAIAQTTDAFGGRVASTSTA